MLFIISVWTPRSLCDSTIKALLIYIFLLFCTFPMAPQILRGNVWENQTGAQTCRIWNHMTHGPCIHEYFQWPEYGAFPGHSGSILVDSNLIFSIDHHQALISIYQQTTLIQCVLSSQFNLAINETHMAGLTPWAFQGHFFINFGKLICRSALISIKHWSNVSCHASLRSGSTL